MSADTTAIRAAYDRVIAAYIKLDACGRESWMYAQILEELKQARAEMEKLLG